MGGSGVQRWLKFSKYLPKNNWQPHIYTPENPAYSLNDETLLKDIPEEAVVIKQPIWEPYSIYQKLSGGKKSVKNYGFTNSNKKSILQKFASWVRGNLFIPDPRVYWVKPSVKFLKKYINQNNIEHIVTTGPPHSMHLIANQLKKDNPNLKWIADMRDPWANFDVLHQFNLSKFAINKQKALEKDVLANADKVLFVSEGQIDDFQAVEKSKISIITNGFDLDDFSNQVKMSSSMFTISHIGLLNELRDPSAFFAALNKLAIKNENFKNKFRLRLVGNVSAYIKGMALNFPAIKNNIEFIDYLSHKEVLVEYENADLLLLLPNQTENGKGQIPGKVFEYMAAEKPTLTLGYTKSSIASIINETEIGFVAQFDNVIQIENALKTLFQNHQNKIDFKPNKAAIKKYTRANLTEKLAALLESL